MGGRGAFLKIWVQASVSSREAGTVWYSSSMNIEIDDEKYYYIEDEQHYCCDESQFKYYCKICDEFMGCYFCEFSYTEPHGCDTV